MIRDYEPDGKVLTEFFWDRSRLGIIQGPIQSGTSSACCHRLWVQAEEQLPDDDGVRRTRWIVTRDTYKDLRETTIKTWLHWFPEAIWGPFIRAEPGYHALKRPHSSGDGTTVDAEVIFLALPDPDVAEKVLASYEITGFFRNEAQFAEKRVIDELLSRCARYPSKSFGPGATWYGGFLDLNAPVEGHWIPYMRGDIPIPADWTDEQRQAMECPEGWEFFVQPPGLIEEMKDGRVTYRENPLAENQKWTTQPYLELIRGKDKDWIDQRVLNKIGVYRGGKPVYPQFFPTDHVAADDIAPVEAPLIVGLDFGREPAAAICQCINGQWRVLAELIGSNESAVLFAPRLKRFLAQKFPGMKAEFWGDPRGADKGQNDETTAYEIFDANGMKVMPATTDNNVEMRRSAMASVLMRRNGLKVNPSCTTLKVGMGGGYHFPKIRGTGYFSERPNKNSVYSHICEAFENAVLGGGEGDAIVQSPNRPKPVASPIRRHKVNLRRAG